MLATDKLYTAIFNDNLPIILMGLITARIPARLSILAIVLLGFIDAVSFADGFSTKLMESFISDCAQGNLINAERWIRKGASVNYRNADGQTPLAVAIRNQRTEIVRLLLEHGAHVKGFTDKNGWTLLMLAVSSAPYNRAELDAKNKTSVSAPMPAPSNLQNEILELLIAHGAPMDGEDLNGETALTLAAGQGRAGIVRQLVRQGAPVNQRNRSGKTALMLAAHDGDKELVESLIQSGADVTLRDNSSQTASDLAEAWRFPEIVKILNAEMRRER